jgi:type IV secretion system protein VirD4
MKFKIVASQRDVMIFIMFAIFLLYVIALGVLNIPSLASEGVFYGLNPVEAFSPKYIYFTIIFYIIALIGLIFSVNSYFFEFQEGVGFKIGGSSGGYSDWAKAKDIKNDKDVERVVCADPHAEAAGMPLISNGKEMWVDNGEYHTLVIGSTGSGKTQCTILPQMKVLAKKRESIIVTDPKAEIYEKTGGLLKKMGYNILLLNFRDPQNGNSWNPLELPYKLYKSGNQDKAIELLDDLALNIMYDESNANQDPFWEKTASDYFSGVALAMFEDTTEDKININSINMTASIGDEKFGGSTYVKEYFNYKDPSSAAFVNASGTVNSPSETKGGIISVFKQKVKLFANRENLSEMLSYSDFSLDSIGTQPTAVFIIIQDEKKTLHPLATIFIKQVYETLIDVAQKNGGKLPVRTNFLLDEFANMPPLKDVTTMITAARSRQIRFTLIIQNFAQLNKVYGKDDAETIKGNCGNIIYLISTELAALEEISKLCGDKKSKKDDKTASTPLVTVSDLQRMKQFDMILLRLRKNPYKESFVPDFKINWGFNTNEKVEYPHREKREVKIFDIREFVKEKKNQKINEMMASITEEANANPFETSSSKPSSSGGMNFSDIKSSIMPNTNRRKEPEISVNDLVKKIDEKLAEIEKEEQMEKEKKEKEAKEKESKEKKETEEKSSSKDLNLDDYFNKQTKEDKSDKSDKTESTVVNNYNYNYNYYTDKKEDNSNTKKTTNVQDVELLDDEDEDDEDNGGIFISNEEIQRKVNQKLYDDYLEEQDKLKDKTIKETIKVIDTPKKSNPIDDELLKQIETSINNINKAKEEVVDAKIEEVETTPKKNVENTNFKPTSTIKLDDVKNDDEFFDEFFDD